jgi:uncharacterized membrane protein YdjX (TVP38/TMEM64 family)
MLVGQIKYFIEQDPGLTALYLIIGKVVGAVLFFPGSPLTLLAGATLGVFWGSVTSIIGNTLGAILAFVVSRYALKGYVRKTLYTKYSKIKAYEDRFFKHGIRTVIILRLIPLFPFNALNYLLGVTQVTLYEYSVGTALGMIPGTLVYVYFGNSIAMLGVSHIIFSGIALGLLIYFGKSYQKRQW